MTHPGPQKKRAIQQPAFIPHLDRLEDRALPSAVSFSSPVSYSAGGFPAAVAVGDFNGDGKPDLAVANNQSNNVSVLLGNGDGTFQTAQNFAAGGVPVAVAVGDFNGDGKLDVAVANPLSNSVSVLLGNGDGTLQTAQNFAVGTNPSSVAVGDFDGRHYANGSPILDLAVANDGSSTVSVLLGNGDGTFQTTTNFATGSHPHSVAVGDFNGDGKPDLAVADLRSKNVSVLVGNGDGTFQTAQSFAVGSDPFSVAVGDFDGRTYANGQPVLDLAVANAGSGTVSVLLGNGDGTFQTARNFATGSVPRAVAVADFNGDNVPDLVVGYVGGDDGNSVSILLGNGDGTFQTAQNFGGDFGAVAVAVGDFNGDGRPDFATAADVIDVLLNQDVTATAISGPTSSTYGQSVTYTATVSNGSTPMTAGTVTFLDGNTPISPALPLDANGQATFSIATLNASSYTITASYSGTTGGAGITPFGASADSTSLMVNPAPLSATAINFSAIAGAPFTGGIVTFTNADPFGDASSYTAVIDWGDGTTSTGTITGTGTLTVSGPHTYAAAGNYALSVQISHNLGDTTTAIVYPTATVVNLGQSVQGGLTGGTGFWNNKNGQRLIDSFNGGPDSTALSTWLATSFPNLFGDLHGFRNSDVAAFYQSQFAQPGSNNLQVELLATGLNIYATTQSLGGTAAEAYGFQVTATGLGADSFNVGSDGAAFGVANNTILNVYALLEAVNEEALNGFFDPSNTILQKEASDLFNALDKAGAIS
jgi:hypothetical protein